MNQFVWFSPPKVAWKRVSATEREVPTKGYWPLAVWGRAKIATPRCLEWLSIFPFGCNVNLGESTRWDTTLLIV